MNEIQLIRNHLATERQHAREVANTCAGALARAGAPVSGSPLELFGQACVDYLVCVLAWFEERDQRMTDLFQSRLAAEDPARRALEEVLARPGRSRDALEKLEAAFAAPASRDGGAARGWQEFARYFNGVWGTRRDAIEALLAANPRVADWRAISGLDADSVLEERSRYARVCAALPAGLALTPPEGR